MARRIVMIACLTAGVALLTGPGWALLALGVLVEVAWPHTQPAWLPGVVARVRGWLDAAKATPRRVLAASTMTVGVLVIPTGVLLLAGVGAAMVVAGMLAVGEGLLLGWNS